MWIPLQYLQSTEPPGDVAIDLWTKGGTNYLSDARIA
jgi:hypothetical protein